MRLNTAPRRKNAPLPKAKEMPHAQWIRGRGCHLAGHAAGGCGFADPPRKSPVEAAHVNHAGGGGMGIKADGQHIIPLCQRHHDEQHGKIGSFSQRGGWETFQIKYGFNAVDVARGYWLAWLRTPMGQAWEARNG